MLNTLVQQAAKNNTTISIAEFHNPLEADAFISQSENKKEFYRISPNKIATVANKQCFSKSWCNVREFQINASESEQLQAKLLNSAILQ